MRLPDFLVIGAAKSGTTSLFEWLGTHPNTWLPEVKEPYFFTREKVWALGLDWYGELFAGAPDGSLTGEATTALTRFASSEKAAARIAEVIPHARLIYVVREPISRLRSHYAMKVRTGEELRFFEEALAHSNPGYVNDSCYHQCLRPYLDRFPAEQLLVVRMEDVFAGSHSGWAEILDHLGLSQVPVPRSTHNVAEGQYATRPLMYWLREHGITAPPSWIPRWVRSAARPMFLRDPKRDARLLSGKGPIPDPIVGRILEDADRLAAALGREPLWPSPQHV
jgi:hypothetical protein